MSEQKRLTQLSNIRALCIFIVVFIHSIILYSSTWDFYSTDVSVPFLDKLKECIVYLAMPLFFSLSGYLFVHTHQKRRGFLHLLRSKAARLLIPYLGVGLLFMVPVKMLVGYSGYQGISFPELCAVFALCTDVGHLWFLPVLFLMFFLSELILSIAERIPVVRDYPEFALCMVAGLLYLEGYRFNMGYVPFQSAFTNLIWFASGYLLYVRRAWFSALYRNPVARTALVAAAAALLTWQNFVEPLAWILYLTAVFLFIANCYGIMPHKTCPLIEKVDRNSFGIYLFHSPLIYITFANIPNAHPAIVVFVNLVLFGAAAYGLTALVRRTKLKFLIGE